MFKNKTFLGFLSVVGLALLAFQIFAIVVSYTENSLAVNGDSINTLAQVAGPSGGASGSQCDLSKKVTTSSGNTSCWDRPIGKSCEERVQAQLLATACKLDPKALCATVPAPDSCRFLGAQNGWNPAPTVKCTSAPGFKGWLPIGGKMICSYTAGVAECNNLCQLIPGKTKTNLLNGVRSTGSGGVGQ